jgi:class 3 adenylate cyclase/predicted ATPase
MVCPSCHSKTPDDSRFCEACGAALSNRCQSCGAILRAGARFCIKCGKKIDAETNTATAGRGITQSASPSAERRHLTVMFCDLVGSTELSGRLDPEDMREVIGAYHRCCAAQIAGAGGFVAKYMGDGVLTYFGFPQTHEDDAERAVSAGLALVEAVAKLRVAHEETLRVRIGIATGLVVVGDLIGEGVSQEHGIVGETPNLAARLQAVAAPGWVVISDGTRRLIGDLFVYLDMGSIEIKGFAAPVNATRVLSVSTLQSRFEALRSGKLPLIGREEEIALLLNRWVKAKEGEGAAILLSGEAGIGKSRAIQAFRERLSGEPHITLSYFCSPNHQDSAFHPIIAHLERAADFGRDDAPQMKLTKLQTILSPASAGLEEIGLIAELLSLPIEGRYQLPDLSPQKRKEKRINALVRQLVGLANRQPVLILFEDAHWIDPSTLDWLSLIVDKISQASILLIITARPQFAAPWKSAAYAATVELSRLSWNQGALLIQNVSGNRALPPTVADQILSRTDGVPLFVEELTKTVLESGLLREEDGRFTLVEPLPPLAIPDTLHASLLARIDRLGSARELAQVGAALGRQFSHRLIGAVAPLTEEALRSALDELVAAELIYRDGSPPDAEYAFKHALVQDAAYSTLLRSTRQQMHSRIARTLEHEFPEITQAQPELVAHHCTEAGLIEQAIDYYRKAADRAMAASANVEAIAHLTKALTLLGSLGVAPKRDAQELGLRIALGATFTATRGYAAPEVEAAYTRARELCGGAAESIELFQTFYGLWLFNLVRGRANAAMELALRLASLAARLGNPDVLPQGPGVLTVTHFWLGQLISVPSFAQRTIASYDPERHRGRLSTIYSNDPAVAAHSHLALALWLLGYPDQAVEQIKAAISVAGEVSHAQTTAVALQWSAFLNHMQRNPTAESEATRALTALAAEQGLLLYIVNGSIHDAAARCERGEDALDQMQQALATRLAIGADLSQPFFQELFATSLSKAGKVSEALETLKDALERVERTNETWWEPEIRRVTGDLLRLSSSAATAEAESAYLRSIERARDIQARSLELRASVSLARLWCEQCRRIEARNLLEPIYKWFTEGFNTPDLKEAKTLLDELT